jgi:phosphatidate cytidylyltransferase
MLRWRIAVSVILVPALIALFWLDSLLGNSAPVFLALCLILALRGSYEMVELLKTRNLVPSYAAAGTGSVLAVLSGWMHFWMSSSGQQHHILISMGWIGTAMALSFCGLLVREACVFEEPGRSMESLGSNTLIVMYAGFLLAVTAQFRWFPDPRLCYFAIGSMIIAVKSGDIGAYTFGRLWGKRKMAPRLSPGKTWMGFIGALVGSAVGGWLWLNYAGRLFDVRPVAASAVIVIAYGMFLGVIGLIGDLCESLIKRDVAKKDSASLMPGFGGLLDLLDSPLFAGPFALAWWHLWPPAIVSG